MCGSALVRWDGCASLTWDQPWFSYRQNLQWNRGKFSLGTSLQAEVLCLLHPHFANHTGYVAVSVPVFLPRLLLLLGCILPQCEFLESAELFPSFLGRHVSPRAGPAFPAGSTSLQLPALPAQPLPCCPWHWTLLISPTYPNFTHTRGRVFCFVFTIEFQPWVRNSASENKGHLPFLSLSHSYLVFPLWFF